MYLTATDRALGYLRFQGHTSFLIQLKRGGEHMSVVRGKTIECQPLTTEESLHFLVRNFTVADDSHHIEVAGRVWPDMVLTGITLTRFLHSSTAYRAAAFHIVRHKIQMHFTILDDEHGQEWLVLLVLHLHDARPALTEQLTANLLRHFHPMHLAVDDELTTPTLLGRAVATESQWRLHYVATTYGTFSNYILFCHFYLFSCYIVSFFFHPL